MSSNQNNSPFKLFEAYSARDKNVFFGRDEEIYALYNLLQQTRIVLMYGASGTGKTSLIQAGLPKVFKLSDWYCISVRRKDNINDSLAAELAHAANQPSITDIHQAIDDIYKSCWIPIYLVFDQFEEVFTIGNNDERVTFFKSIEKLLDDAQPCKVIISMREEYIGHLYEYEHFVPTMFDKRFRVEPMNDETARKVVEQTCQVGGVTLEEGEITAKHILQQVKVGIHAVHLPYLQVYLYYLYENALKTIGQPIFSEEIIAQVGKLGNVLKLFIGEQIKKAEKFFAEKLGLPHKYPSLLLDQFATAEGTKKSHTITDLSRELNTPADKILATLNYFSEGKLLRADENEIERYEPVHDVVAKQIHELRSAEDIEFKHILAQLEIDYTQWEKGGKKEERYLPELDIIKIYKRKERFEQLENYKNIWGSFVKDSDEYHKKIKKEKEEQLQKEQTLRHEAENAKEIADQQRVKAKRQERRAYRLLVGLVIIGLIATVVSGISYISNQKKNIEVLKELIAAKEAHAAQFLLKIGDSRRKKEIYISAQEDKLVELEQANIDSYSALIEDDKNEVKEHTEELQDLQSNKLIKFFLIKK